MATDLELYAQGDRTRLRQLHVLANAPTLVPDSFKSGGGEVRWGDVALAAHHAAALDLDPVANLKLFPVIKGAVFPMAEVWQVLARRHGWRVTTLVDTAERCVVDMVHRSGEHPPPFEMTLAEAKDLGAAKTNPNYKDGGARSMVRARAIRTAIKLNAPEVMQDPVAADWADLDEISGPADGEEREAVAVPYPDTDGRTGSAGPETRRRPATDAARQRLAEAIVGLSDPVREDLRRAARDVELPNLHSDRFTLADAALLERLITEALARAEIYAYQEVMDDQPEAATHDDQSETYRYSPEDEAPF